MNFLLDTHILLWWVAESDRLSSAQRTILSGVSPDRPLLVSDITLWEIANLQELGRIQLQFPLREWLERATAAPLVRRCGVTPTIAAQVADLPKSFHRDPADRIIVSTAMVFRANLLTADDRIIQSGLVPVT